MIHIVGYQLLSCSPLFSTPHSPLPSLFPSPPTLPLPLLPLPLLPLPLPPLSISVDYNLDDAESDDLLLDLLESVDDLLVDDHNLKERETNRHPTLFGLYPLPRREESLENRTPANPPTENEVLKLLIKISDLKYVNVSCWYGLLLLLLVTVAIGYCCYRLLVTVAIWLLLVIQMLILVLTNFFIL